MEERIIKQNRTITRNIRITESEAALFEEAAADCGMTWSEYMRKCALKGSGGFAKKSAKALMLSLVYESRKINMEIMSLFQDEDIVVDESVMEKYAELRNTTVHIEEMVDKVIDCVKEKLD